MKNPALLLAALKILKSDKCICGKHKEAYKKVFCLECYSRLPKDMQADLYQKAGNGFEEAVDVAINYLMDKSEIV